MKVMSTCIFIILTRYCHIDPQQERVSMQVRAETPLSSKRTFWSQTTSYPFISHITTIKPPLHTDTMLTQHLLAAISQAFPIISTLSNYIKICSYTGLTQHKRPEDRANKLASRDYHKRLHSHLSCWPRTSPKQNLPLVPFSQHGHSHPNIYTITDT